MNTTVRRVAYSIAVVILAVYGCFALKGPQGVTAVLDKQKLIREYEEQNANARREIEYKKNRIRRLRESPAEQELAIRDRLKLLRPDETTFILPPSAKTAEPAAPSPSLK